MCVLAGCNTSATQGPSRVTATVVTPGAAVVPSPSTPRPAASYDVPDLPGPGVPSVSADAPSLVGRWRNITPKSINPARHPCTDLALDATNPGTLYAFYGDGGGVWRSSDAGATWFRIGDLPMPNSLGRILVNPRNPRHLYATGSVTLGSWGFWVSRDGGQSWTMPPAFLAGASSTWNMDVYNVAADPSDFNHVLLTFHRGWPDLGDSAGVLETKDGGASYIVHAPAHGMDHGQGIAFLYNPATSQGNADTWLVGAGYGSGLWRTTDAGKTWQQVSRLQQDHGGFDAHYSSQGFLYIGARDGVFRSTDNGETWNATGIRGGWYYGVIGDGKHLYASPAYVGQRFHAPFAVTPEGGPNEGLDAWVPYNDQIFDEGPWRMAFDARGGNVYAAHWGGGAWALRVER